MTPPSPSTSHAPTPLLVVDDEPELRSLLAEYLARHGFEVCSAPDAAAARQLVGEAPPQLALLDD